MGHFPPLFCVCFRRLSPKSHNFFHFNIFYVHVCMYVTIYSYIHTYILFMPFTVLVRGLRGQIKKSLMP